MDITVENVDDINYIIRGTVENSVVEAMIATLKEEQDESVPDDKIEQEAAGKAFRDFIDAGIQKAGIAVEDLLGQPGLKQYEKKDNDVYFEVDIAVSPTINADVDYSGIIPTYEKPEASPDAVEKKLSEFISKNAPFAPIETPKNVEEGDVALIDFDGYIDGKPFEGGKAEQFKLQIGSNAFIPGFEPQLIGMAYGETRTIDVTFPEDYQSPDLAGKQAQFVVKLHEIQAQKAVTPDDAYAKKILSDENATLETLNEKFADQVRADALSALYNNTLKPRLIEGLLGLFDFPLPNNIVEQEIDAKIRERMQTLSKEEQQAQLNDPEKFQALRDAVRPEARDGIKIAMIVEALAKKEGVEVDEQEVLSALGYHAMITGQDAQALVKYYQENNLMTSAKLGLTEDKLFGQMLSFHK